MKKYLTFSIRFVMAVSLACAVLASCQSQGTAPTAVTTLTVPTDTLIPPSPTSIPPTAIPPTVRPSPTPLPSVQALALQDILGDWKSKCGGNDCLWRFKADGTYEVYDYYQGATGVEFEGGTITITDGVFHLASSSNAACASTPNGYYQIFRTDKDGKPLSLHFEPSQPDECADRQSSLKLTLTFVNP